jgi:predicted Zn-dependent protease
MSIKNQFYAISEKVLAETRDGEYIRLSFNGEKSDFVRFNNAKIRQTTSVEQNSITLILVAGKKKISSTISVELIDPEKDITNIINDLNYRREMIEFLPEDPYIFIPQSSQSSSVESLSTELKTEKMLDDILSLASGLDFCGFFTNGDVFRGYTDSIGSKHWYAKTSFFLDYSLYSEKQKAVKSTLGGEAWSIDELKKDLELKKLELNKLGGEAKILEPGKYRAYLSPYAAGELVSMLHWGGMSYSAYKQGLSPMHKAYDGEKFSQEFTLLEDFTMEASQAFNDWGELSSDKIELIKNGELKTFLINQRTAKEHGVDSNAANGGEQLRSPKVLPGKISESEILKELGTGIYISHLWYLNYSHRPSGSITGMTRFGCFWVEGGEIVAPIKEMRFDDNYYHIFGNGLVGLTDFTKLLPSTDTYFQRNIGALEAPGIIVDGLSFTL